MSRDGVLDRAAYGVSSERLAPRLIGQRLVRVSESGERLSGIIVETEAYIGPADLASHAAGGRRTARNESMYAPAGTLYVYFTYGMHHCCNVSCAGEGVPEAVLLRALAPEEGIEQMRRRRTRRPRKTALRDRDLCAGPGRLCEALGIDRSLDGADLIEGGTVFIERVRDRVLPSSRLRRTPRIGLGNKAGQWKERPLRWLLAGDPHVSAGGG